MVPLEAGYDRAEMIQPAVMAPPLNWLVSDAAGGVTGGAFSPCTGTRACRRKSRRKSRRRGRLGRDRDNADRAARQLATAAARLALSPVLTPPRRTFVAEHLADPIDDPFAVGNT